MKHTEYFLKELDYRANVHNKAAQRFYEKSGVNCISEQSFEIQKPNHQVALMRCKHCVKYALNLCKSPEQLVLVDELSKKYPLRFNCKDCEMSVLSSD
jgi:putative protease